MMTPDFEGMDCSACGGMSSDQSFEEFCFGDEVPPAVYADLCGFYDPSPMKSGAWEKMINGKNGLPACVGANCQ